MSPETFTAMTRRRLAERQQTCPTCGQATGASLRSLGEATGVPFTVLARFLRGGDMMGRNLDLVHAWLDRHELLGLPHGPLSEPREGNDR